MNAKPRDSCREIFIKFEIMTLYSQYICSWLLCIANNKYLFNLNNQIHKYNTRLHSDLHVPIANITKFHNGAYISGIKIYSHLPQAIKFWPIMRNVSNWYWRCSCIIILFIL
jgi:hypothetical protein